MTLSDSLAVLLEDGIIQDVLGRIMSGKEAEVYAVLRNDEACAAKIYKPRHQRSFKNNSAYTEGRIMTRDTRARRAIAKGTTFGKEMEEKSWKDTEHDALQLAWQAGVRVPQPIFLYEDALLMQLVVDDEGMPAPRMSDLSFSPEQALALHAEMFENIRKLLAVHRVHGDLSAFNILMGVDGATIIDMPQVIDSAANLRANEFLERDVFNVTEYLARFAPSLMQYAGAGRGLWRHYRAGTLHEAQVQDLAEAPRPHQRRDPPPARAAAQDDRQVRSDGRVEVVMNGGNQRRNRGFSRDGRANEGPRNQPANVRRDERDGPRPQRQEARAPQAERAPRPEGGGQNRGQNRPPRQPQNQQPQQNRPPRQDGPQQPRQDRPPQQPRTPQPPRQERAEGTPPPPRQGRPPRQDGAPQQQRPPRAQGPNPAHHGEHRGHGRHR